MKKRRIIILIVLLLAMAGITSAFISAWLTDTDTTGPTTFTVGDVEYTWVPGTLAESPIVPGQDLITGTYSLTNTSNVNSELRVKIYATYTLDGTETAEDALDLFETISLMTGWTLNETDGKWYYTVTGDNPTTITPSITSINVIDELVLDGAKVGNLYTKATFAFTFEFEAKQKDYVEWEDLGVANFDFGEGIVVED
ncbi:MAG: hypothetical protein PHX62_06700 [Bacilli bacterium]|nr:hypothetical protein [Bacilli bacterium]